MNGNSIVVKTLGIMLVALALIFGFIDGLPWPSKDRVAAVEAEVDQLRTDLDNRLKRIEDNVDWLVKKAGKKE